MAQEIVTGSYASTGVLVNIVTGFTPSGVKIFNKTTMDASETFDMVDGFLTTAASGIVTAEDGITAYNSTSAGKGFTVAATASCTPNATGNTIYWIAYR